MPRSSRICIDANLVVRLVSLPKNELVWQLWDQWHASRTSFDAPLLLRYKVVNAFHRLSMSNPDASNIAAQGLLAAFALPITLHTDDDLHLSALEFASRFNLPAAYDAHYLALAAKLGTEFWTADRRLANTVRPHLDWVRLAA